MKAVFFDLDGTLLDSLEDLADTANSVLVRHGYPSHAIDAYRYFVGDGMETLLRRAAPDSLGEEEFSRLLEPMREEYGKSWAKKSRPYNGIVPMLLELVEREVILAVLSNKPHEFAVLAVEHFFPNIHFAKIQGSPRGGKAKPDPSLALDMAREFKLAPGEVIFMGDSSIDMDTAVAAGMLPVGVLWGFRTEDELKRHGAKILLERPGDIFRHL